MTSSCVPWWISVLWISLTLVTFLVVDAAPVGLLARSVLMTAIGIIPPVVFLALWSEGPPSTVAEVLFAAEGGR